MELDDFRVSCIQGYPYEGFVIGCGYAYVENIPSEMAILENSSYIQSNKSSTNRHFFVGNYQEPSFDT